MQSNMVNQKECGKIRFLSIKHKIPTGKESRNVIKNGICTNTQYEVWNVKVYVPEDGVHQVSDHHDRE